MEQVKFLEGLTRLQERLIDVCRAISENERVLVTAKEILREIAIQDLQMDEHDFEYECEAINSQVDPIESYEIGSVGYAYRLFLQMGVPWHCRYPFFDLRGMIGDAHDDVPHGPEYVEARLSAFCHTVMPVGRPPLLPIALLNGVTLLDGTRIPPHNIEELWVAFEQIRQNPEMPVDELMEFIPGPDFATGGVVSVEGIRPLYTDGKGELILRGHLEAQIEGTRTRIFITDVPSGVQVRTVIAQIRSLAERRLVQFYNIRDLSQRGAIRILLEAPRDYPVARLKEILYRETDLEKRLCFKCGVTDAAGFQGDGSLVETLRQAASRCTPSWQRKDGEPIEYVPLLREVYEYGGYKSPLSDFIDVRRSRLLYDA